MLLSTGLAGSNREAMQQATSALESGKARAYASDRVILVGLLIESGLTDKFGLSWQIIPSALVELLSQPDPQKSRRVMEAMLKMGKLDIAGLQRAYEGR